MSLAVLADHMASKGRGPDSMLIHMSPREVQGLQALAMKHGGSLTINPDTGLPEAGFLDKLLPAILGFALAPMTAGTSLAFLGATPLASAMTVGALQTLRTGDIGKGLMAGFGAYGGAGLQAGLANAGASTLAGEGIAAEAAKNAAAEGITLPSNYAEMAARTATPEQIAAAKAASGPMELLSAGAKSASASPEAMGSFAKDNFKNLAYAAGPILADQAVKANLPTTTTRPGAVRTFSYNPYDQLYTPTGNYEVPVKAADGGLMGMAEGGMFDFVQRSEPVVRMAEGGVPGYAGGALVNDQQIFDYFKTPGLTDAQIAADMQKFNVSAADIARATGTQNQQADYEKRFVNTLVAPGTDASEFLAATKSVGLKDQALATAMQNAGLSQGAQYALTHADSDAGFTNGITDARTGKPVDLYTNIGYTAGALPGDQGGLEGMYANINYAASGLQNQINTGKMSVADAQNAALAELARTGVSVADVENATGSKFGDLFKPKVEAKKPKVEAKKPFTCPDGYTLNAEGTACIKNADTTILKTDDTKNCPTGYHYDPATKSCVPNISATQNTTSIVTTPTDISTASSTALPVGVSGAGITTINPNGTITTRPNIPGIPEGGFTGMESLRDAYTAGGGSLGYVPYVPKTIEEFDKKYNKLTGGSKSAYDYLTGKTKYSATPYTETGEIMKPYSESVLGVPMNLSSKKVLFDPVTKTYKQNPDYIPVSYTDKGEKVYGLSSRDISTQLSGMEAKSDYEKWMKDNNVTIAQIAQALGISLAEAKKRYGATTKAADTADTSSSYVDAGGGDGDGGGDGGGDGDGDGDGGSTTAKRGGLMAMAMARGGAAQFNLGDYSDGGRLLRGPGDGVSDSIPASIGNKRPARLADGEFVVPARIVSELGNGSTEAGARKLYAMMDRIQSARRGTVGKGKVAKNSRADKHLPA